MIQKVLKRSVSFVPWRLRGVVKKIPLVAPLQRWLLTKYLEGREFVHIVDAGPARGLRYPVRLPEDKNIWTGMDELFVSTALCQAIPEGGVCVDAGAWHGFFAGVMALAGAKKVYIFEPFPDNCVRIHKLMKLNPLLTMQLFQAALGDKSGNGEFRITQSSDTGKLANSPILEQGTNKGSIQVRVHALDELIAAGTIEAPDVIKLDVEGAELLVLKGASTLLASSKPILLIEVHSRSLAWECYKLLKDHGYEVCVLETNRPPDFITEPEVCHFYANPR
jgi:FkbM family methyltransferase